MKLKLQHLANLQAHAWEIQQRIGNARDPEDLRKLLNEAGDQQIYFLLEHLSLLYKTVEEIGQSEVELSAAGHPSLFAALVNTASSSMSGSPEVELPPAVVKAVDAAVAKAVARKDG